MATPLFGFNDGTGEFYWLRGPNRDRSISRLVLRSSLDDYLDNKSAQGEFLARQLRDREITIAQWQRIMERESAKVHIAAMAAARGGRHNVTTADYGRVAQLVRDERVYLTSLALEVEKGLPLDGRFTQRVRQYFQAGRVTYHTIEEQDMAARGYDEVRSVRHARDSCEECIWLAHLGWQPVGTIKLPGTRKCRRNCRCGLEYRKSWLFRRIDDSIPQQLQNTQDTPPAATSPAPTKVRPLPTFRVNLPRIKTARDAESWAQARGIDASYGSQVHIARYATQAIAELEAIGLPLPLSVKVDAGMFSGRDRLTPALTLGQTIFINPNAPYWANNGANAAKRAKQHYRKGFWSTSHVLHPIRHEFGHTTRAANAWRTPAGDLRLLWLAAKARGEAKDFSQYAYDSDDPEEFVAEVLAALINRQQIPSDVWTLYNQLGGPLPKGIVIG